MKDLKIFTDNIDAKAVEQINELLSLDAFSTCKVRIMPDVHAGKGCVIGFTANLNEKVIPNIVGVDIGCGMSWVQTDLREGDIDLATIDEIIRKNVPSGSSVRAKRDIIPCSLDLTQLYCYSELENVNFHLERSMGTLGGGNHFYEIDKDTNGNLVFVVHSGSRHLGNQVCTIYQRKAIEYCAKENKRLARRNEIVSTLKAEGRHSEIQAALERIDEEFKGYTDLPVYLCYLEGEEREKYLHDMRLCQKWASENRRNMLSQVIDRLKEIKDFNTTYRETIHNYIGDDNIVRKGAISAYAGEIVLIPINMRDGCIIGRGKGNEDWNQSAPHGAGRIMSRRTAQEKLSLEEYRAEMKDVYTTSVCESTLDEAPMAYKSMDEIIAHVTDTIDIIEIIKPIYNFKAKES